MSTETQTPRTFYRSDYRRAAKMVQAMRHVQGDRYTAKPQAQQVRVDELASMLSAVFEEDAPEGKFSPDKFMAGTQLPGKPAYEYSEADEHLEASYEGDEG